MEEEDCIGKVSLHSFSLLSVDNLCDNIQSDIVNSLMCPLVSQLTVQLVRTVQRTERALYVRLELINLLGVSHPAFLVVKI